jgi:hypothetical protein
MKEDYTVLKSTRFQVGLPIAVSIGVGLIAALLRWTPPRMVDGDFVLRAVEPLRGFLQGVDPYAQVFSTYTVPYPFPAMCLGWPFINLDSELSGAVFVGLTSALLAYALMRDGAYWRGLLFLSYPFIESVKFAQFSMLLSLAIVLPARCAWPLCLVKPQAALAGMVMDKPTKRSFLIAALALLASLIVFPRWPIEWLNSVGSYKVILPVLMPFGCLLVLALVHWRDRHYRALLALAVLPKRSMYDNLFVGLLARDIWELTAFVVWSWLPMVLGIDTAVVLYLMPLAIWLWKDHRLAKVCPNPSSG